MTTVVLSSVQARLDNESVTALSPATSLELQMALLYLTFYLHIMMLSFPVRLTLCSLIILYPRSL